MKNDEALKVSHSTGQGKGSTRQSKGISQNNAFNRYTKRHITSKQRDIYLRHSADILLSLIPYSLLLVYSTPGSKAGDNLKTVERLDCIQVKQSVNHETASLLLCASFGRHITALYPKKTRPETLLFLVQSALGSYKQLQRVSAK